MRVIRRLLLGLVLVLAGGGAFLWWRAGVLTTHQIRPGLIMLSGLGGNVGVLATEAGVVVVDSMTLVRQGRAVRRAIDRLTTQPIAALINTHYHLDHTHGNPAFPVDTPVVATPETLEHLRTRDADFWADPPARDLLPNTMVDDEWTLSLGGKTVRAFHLGRGHTDGDVVVLFVEDRVLHAGDLMWQGYWPNIDLEAGGSMRWWPATLDKVLQLDFDTVIPGHGPPATRADLERFRDFLASLWRQTATLAARGGSVADARAEVDVSEWEMRPLWWFPILTRRFVIGRAHEEAQRLLRNVRGAE